MTIQELETREEFYEILRNLRYAIDSLYSTKRYLEERFKPLEPDVYNTYSSQIDKIKASKEVIKLYDLCQKMATEVEPKKLLGRQILENPTQ